MGSKRKPAKGKDKAARGKVNRTSFRGVVLRTLKVLHTYTIPVADGRKVPDFGAEIVLGKTLSKYYEHYATYSSSARHLATERVGTTALLLYHAFLSVVNQGCRIAMEYAQGEVIPHEAIASLECVGAILEDVAGLMATAQGRNWAAGLKPLSEDARQVLALLLSLPLAEGKTAKELARALGIPEERIRNDIRTELLPHGLMNHPGKGYFIHPEKREAAAAFLGLTD